MVRIHDGAQMFAALALGMHGELEMEPTFNFNIYVSVVLALYSAGSG